LEWLTLQTLRKKKEEEEQQQNIMEYHQLFFIFVDFQLIIDTWIVKCNK